MTVQLKIKKSDNFNNNNSSYKTKTKKWIEEAGKNDDKKYDWCVTKLISPPLLKNNNKSDFSTNFILPNQIYRL